MSAGFFDTKGAAVKRATQQEEFPADLVIDLTPRDAQSGDPYRLEVRLHNRGHRSLIVTGLATLMSVPFGLFTAIYLAEYGHGTKLAKAIQSMVDVMTGIPSIVAGLFAYALFELMFGPGTRSGIAGAVAGASGAASLFREAIRSWI